MKYRRKLVVLIAAGAFVIGGCSSSSTSKAPEVAESSTTSVAPSTTTTIALDCPSATAKFVKLGMNDPKSIQDGAAREALSACTRAQFVEQVTLQSKSAPMGSFGRKLSDNAWALPIDAPKEGVLQVFCSSLYTSDDAARAKLIACTDVW